MSKKHKIWAMLPALPKPIFNEMVRQFEAAGLEGVWAVQLYGSPFVPLCGAATVSERLKLGSGVALAFTRSPLETACSALELDAISEGRCVLGIGPSIKWWNEDWYGVEYGKPLAHLRETVDIVRTIIAEGHTGAIGKIDKQYYQLDFDRFKLHAEPVRQEIPLYLPAVFEKTTQMAGELAQGLLGHPIWAAKWVTEQVEPNLALGLQKSGRAREDLDLNLFLFSAPNEDKAQAIEDARQTIAWYGQMRQYERYYEYIGFGDEARALQKAGEAGDTDAMREACTDAMVEAIALVGPPEELRSRLRQLGEVADSFTIAVPFYGLPPEKAMQYNMAIAETFYGEAG